MAGERRNAVPRFDVKLLPKDLQRKVRTQTTGDLIEVLYTGPVPVLKEWPAKHTAMTPRFEKFGALVKDFKVRPDDVWVITYPKCGTTWTQEMTWLVVNDLDFEGAKLKPLMLRSPFLELGYIAPATNLEIIPMLDTADSPRVIKCHLPVNLLPTELWTVNPKIIYTARNPKDTAISYYHHYRGLQGYDGTLDDFLESFLSGKILYGDYFQHVHEFIRLAKVKENILFLTYEEMKFDMAAVLDSMCQFLGKEYSPEQLIALEHHLKFENMSENPMVNTIGNNKVNFVDDFKFMRKGQVGSHKADLNEAWAKRFDAEIEKWNGIHNFDKKWHD